MKISKEQKKKVKAMNSFEINNYMIALQIYCNMTQEQSDQYIRDCLKEEAIA